MGQVDSKARTRQVKLASRQIGDQVDQPAPSIPVFHFYLSAKNIYSVSPVHTLSSYPPKKTKAPGRVKLNELEKTKQIMQKGVT